jgi:hypothetical protein
MALGLRYVYYQDEQSYERRLGLFARFRSMPGLLV